MFSLAATVSWRIPSRMVKKYKKLVHLNLSPLYYLPEQYPEIGDNHREVYENRISKLYHCRSGASCFIWKQGLSLRDPSQRRDRGRNSEMLKMFRRSWRDWSSSENTFRDMQSVIGCILWERWRNRPGSSRRREWSSRPLCWNEMRQFYWSIL